MIMEAPTSATVATGIAIVVVVFTILMGCFKLWRQKMEMKIPFPKELPMIPNSHYLLGHFKVLLSSDFRQLNDTCKATANKYGQVSMWLGSRKCIMVFDLQDSLTVLNKEQQRLRSFFVKWHAKHFVGPKGLLGLNGREWRLHRAAVSRTFNPEFLSTSRKDMKLITLRMVQNWKQSILNSKVKHGMVQIDVEPAMKNITLDVFGKTSLDTDFGCTTNAGGNKEKGSTHPLVQAFEFMLRQFGNRLSNPLIPTNIFYALPTQQNQRQHKERMLVRSFLSNLITEKRQAIENERQEGITKSSTSGKDLLSHLLRSHAEIKKSNTLEVAQDEITDDDLIDVVMTNFVAGYDTTSIALGFALYLLAQHPNIQDECYQEVMKNTSSNDNDEDDDPNKLQYCKAIILEALRLFPPAIRTNRTVKKPITLQGEFVVPVGTEVYIPIYDIHYNEQYFPSPTSFRPDRWVSKQSDGNWIERGDESSLSSTNDNSPKKEDQKDVSTTMTINGNSSNGNAAQSTADNKKSTTPRRNVMGARVKRAYSGEFAGPPSSENTNATKPTIVAGNKSALLAFSAGARNCVGYKFALQEATIVLANLIKEIKFNLVPGFTLKTSTKALLHKPENGLPLLLSIRTNKG